MGWQEGFSLAARMKAARQVADWGRSSPAFRSSRIAGGPARWPAREGGRQGCGLAAMGAIGIRLGSADGWNPIEQDGREAAPTRAPQSRSSLQHQEPGCLGSDGRDRDARVAVALPLTAGDISPDQLQSRLLDIDPGELRW